MKEKTREISLTPGLASVLMAGVAAAALFQAVAVQTAQAQALPSPPHSSGGESASGGVGGGIGADGEGIAGSAGGGGGGPGAAGGADGGGSGGSHGNESNPIGGDGEHGGGLTSGGGGGGHGYWGEDIPAADDIAGGNGGRGNSGGGGGAGGYGAFVTNGGTAEIADSQSLRGGDGGLGSSIDRDNRGRGGDGGAGLYFQGDSLTNAGRLSGGSSGDGNVTWDLDGGDGGAGLIFDGRELTNRGTISGGDGGPARQGDGGFGGTGLDFNGTTFVNDDDGKISGGAGGRMEHDEFDGGVGGIGLVFDGSDLTNRGSIFGGEGGAGAGNDGGIGLTFSGGELINQGAISGGDGGRAHLGTGSDGGDGGVGIIVEADGARIVNEGAISGGDGGESGNGVGGAGNVGVIVEADGATIVNAGTISGGSGRGRAAALILNGDDGTLELRADHAFQGDVVANGANATLALGDVERFDVEDLGSLYRGFENFVNRSGSGTMLTGHDRAGTDWLVEGNSALLVDTDSLRGDVEVQNNAALVFNQSFDGIYAGAVSGDGTLMVESAGGRLTLHGDGIDIGGLQVQAGGLLVGDESRSARVTAGDVRVGTGAYLGGSGRITVDDAVQIGSGGALLPGGQPDGEAPLRELTVDGDLHFNRDSLFAVQVDPLSGESDHVHVTGTAGLAGQVVHIGLERDYQPESRFRILTAEGGLEGEFDEVLSLYYFLDSELLYADDGVDLRLTRNDAAFESPARSGNQMATAAAIESLGAGHPLHDAIVTHPDDAQALRRAYDSLSGEHAAATQVAMSEGMQQVRALAQARGRAVSRDQTASKRPSPRASQQASTETVAPALAPASGLNHSSAQRAWGEVFGAWGETRSDGNAARSQRSTGGFVLGLDGQVGGGWTLGGLAGYSRSDLRTPTLGSDSTVDGYHLGLYAGRTFPSVGAGSLTLTGGAGFAWHEVDTRRSVVFNGFSERLQADYAARSYQLYGELGYLLPWDISGGIALEPYVGLSYLRHESEGYSETAGAGSSAMAALTREKEREDKVFSDLGLRASTGFDLNGTGLALSAGLGWRHDFGSQTPSVTQRFQQGDIFTVSGVAGSRNAALLEAGLALTLGPDAQLSIGYDGQLSSRSQDHAGSVRLSMGF